MIATRKLSDILKKVIDDTNKQYEGTDMEGMDAVSRQLRRITIDTRRIKK